MPAVPSVSLNQLRSYPARSLANPSQKPVSTLPKDHVVESVDLSDKVKKVYVPEPGLFSAMGQVAQAVGEAVAPPEDKVERSGELAVMAAVGGALTLTATSLAVGGLPMLILTACGLALAKDGLECLANALESRENLKKSEPTPSPEEFHFSDSTPSMRRKVPRALS